MALLMSCSEDLTLPHLRSDTDEIVFAGFGTNSLNLFSAAPDGSGTRQITHGPGHDYFPRFSPVADTVAFMRIGEGETYQIWLLDMNSLAVTRLTDDTLRKNGGLAWSPDGARIVFAASETAQAKSDLYVLDIETKVVTNITAQIASDRADRSFLFPDWSVHDEIVFTKNDSLYWISPTGSVLRKQHYSGVPTAPRWSSNGESIAFTHVSGSSIPATMRIAILDRWGGALRFVSTPQEAALSPEWSPSGAEIAYASDREGDFEIFVMSAGGGIPRNVSKRPGEDGVPAWR